jgi:hypothetical protein
LSHRQRDRRGGDHPAALSPLAWAVGNAARCRHAKRRTYRVSRFGFVLELPAWCLFRFGAGAAATRVRFPPPPLGSRYVCAQCCRAFCSFACTARRVFFAYGVAPLRCCRPAWPGRGCVAVQTSLSRPSSRSLVRRERAGCQHQPTRARARVGRRVGRARSHRRRRWLATMLAPARRPGSRAPELVLAHLLIFADAYAGRSDRR